MVLTQGPPPQRQFRTLAHMLLPIISAQPYIHAAMWMDNPVDVTHELIHWRRPYYKPTQTLAESQAQSLGITLTDFSPWLTNIEPDPMMQNKVVVTRSPRYQNRAFPWNRIGAHYKDRLVFIGLPQEHHALQRAMGRVMPHKRIRDHLHAAQIIKGSSLFISNQTGFYWLAAGMGHPLIQECEVTRKIWDAQVPRDNAQYWKGGSIHFP